MSVTLEPLTGIVTTDLSAVARGRFIAADRLEKTAATGIGWLQANISLTAFNSIAVPNPWGSSGDLRILPDTGARYRTANTGSEVPFDMVFGNIVELDGRPWPLCSRSILASALADLEAETGLKLVAAFEQEFQLLDSGLPPEHVLSFAGLRRAGGFPAQMMAALKEAGVAPEVIIAEFGVDQFEVTCAPSPAIEAADRAVAIREITREIARNRGWRASFAPKTEPNAVGNGVHIHFSLVDAGGRQATYDGAAPHGLSAQAGAFCAGVLRHLPAITALTASSPPSYYRLKPHHWSSSYTWLGAQDREATLRICPVTTIGGKDPAGQYNIEYRAADGTANPYLALAAIVRAGIEGLKAKLPTPPVFSGDPDLLSEAERGEWGLRRLPQTLEAALDAFTADTTVTGWFDPLLIESFVGIKREELKLVDGKTEAEICDLYRSVY
ncbi:glutamine synthetase family protein [Pseudomonas sp. R2.Fl]|nr:glutamine synthetase family protein [Pseudomonas sp. R2.Fl]